MLLLSGLVLLALVVSIIGLFRPTSQDPDRDVETWTATAHQLTLSTLAPTQTDWVDWPAAATWEVPVPDWAVEVDVHFTLNPGVIGDVWGELRLDIGGDPTVPAMFDVNYEADDGNFPEQAVMQVSDTLPVAAELRGRDVVVTMQGHMLDPVNHAGRLEANQGCHIRGELMFKRTAS